MLRRGEVIEASTSKRIIAFSDDVYPTSNIAERTVSSMWMMIIEWYAQRWPTVMARSNRKYEYMKVQYRCCLIRDSSVRHDHFLVLRCPSLHWWYTDKALTQEIMSRCKVRISDTLKPCGLCLSYCVCWRWHAMVYSKLAKFTGHGEEDRVEQTTIQRNTRQSQKACPLWCMSMLKVERWQKMTLQCSGSRHSPLGTWL